METMKKLKFYKLYDWIIEEMGVSADAGIIAIVQSFAEMGKECCMSYTDFADVLKVSRRQAFNRIKALVNDGYLKAEATNEEEAKETGWKASIYTVNYGKFTGNTPIEENCNTPIEENCNTPIEENCNTLLKEIATPTITEKLKESLTERGENTRKEADTQREPEESHPAPLFGSEEEPIVLNESELFYIRYKVDYTRPRPTNTHKHSAEHYIDLVTSREYPLARVFRFLRDDYYILTDEEAWQRKTEAEHDAELLAAYAQLANE